MADTLDTGTEPADRSTWRRVLLWTAVGLVGVFLLMQLVPYGWKHSNPPVVADAPWPSARAESLARAACYDCHSNETNWRWYSFVAPISWVVRQHVDEGRDALNFSEWEGRGRDAHEATETIQEGSMPPRYYTLMHPSARLSADEKQQLIAALEAMGG